MGKSFKWGIMVIAILLAGLLVLAACCGGDDATKETETPTPATTTPAPTTPAPTTPAPTTPAPTTPAPTTPAPTTPAPTTPPPTTPPPTTPPPTTPPPTTPPVSETVAVYQVTYEDEVTEWTMSFAAEETIEGVDCWVFETEFDENPFRYARPSNSPTKVTGVSYAISKDTLDVIQAKAKVEVMGMALTSTQTNDYSIADHGQPYSVGDTYSNEQETTIDPPLYDPTTAAIDIEVTAEENVTVPAGEFTCFKVELTIAGNPMDTEWYATEYDMILPVKMERYAQYMEQETRELVSYDPMPEKKTDGPACQTLYWFDNDSTECAQKEFCGAYMYYGLQTFETLEACQAALPAGGDEKPVVGTSWVYEVNYDCDEVGVQGKPLTVSNDTTWAVEVTEIEEVNGVECYVTEATISGDAERRYPYPGGVTAATDVPVILSGPTDYRSMETGEKAKESFPLLAQAMGGIALDVAREYTYHDRPAELSVGDTWTYESQVDLDTFLFHEQMNWNAEVVAIESVTVPLGTYDCYKIAAAGTGGLNPDATNYYWWAVDEDFLCPVKYQYNYIFLGTETKELSSYTPAS